MSKQTIYRRARTNPQPYAMISRKTLQDSRLSFKAKGLLSYLLSLPDDWEIHLKEIAKHSTDKLTAIKTATKELVVAGYITMSQGKDAKGRFVSYEYTVYEHPRGLKDVSKRVNREIDWLSSFEKRDREREVFGQVEEQTFKKDIAKAKARGS